MVVIGMHRSGTSLVAELLDEIGVQMGRDLNSHHESKLLKSINEELLAMGGSDSMCPLIPSGGLSDGLPWGIRAVRPDADDRRSPSPRGRAGCPCRRSAMTPTGGEGAGPETIMHLPDAILIGRHKCGSTTLFRWLSVHPDVYGRRKELHFFAGRNSNRPIEWYARQFAEACSNQVVIEGSQSYTAPRHASTACVRMHEVARRQTDLSGQASDRAAALTLSLQGAQRSREPDVRGGRG